MVHISDKQKRNINFYNKQRVESRDKLFQNGYKMEEIFLSFDFFSMSPLYEKQFFFQSQILKQQEY